MISRRLVTGLGLLAVVALATLLAWWFVRTSSLPRSEGLEQGVYTVKAATALLKSNPEALRGESIQIEAYVVNAVAGLGCDDYQILSDSTSTFLQPTLRTGQSLALPRDFYPTVHAIYQGHFFDSWAMRECGPEGYKRFVIEKKIREIVDGAPATSESITVATGVVIARGVYLQSPYVLKIQNHRLTINGVLYQPATEERAQRVTDATDAKLQKALQRLIASLRRNGLVIYGGDQYELSAPSYPPTLIADITALVQSTKTFDEKRSALAMLLDTPTQKGDPIIDDILNNWVVP